MFTAHDRAALCKYGVITSPSAYPELTGQMMTAGLEAALARTPETDRVEGPSLRFGSDDEWAEELAVVGASRNKIEKRLRGIVLNFIRFDILRAKQRGTLLERLLKGFDANRRNKLKHLSPEELAEKMNWTDVVQLIEREWTLFEPIFGDKNQLAQHSQVVNARYDAHAKDADRADLANYRRSLAWFEDALSRAG
jgi:hypothetical protein